MLIFLKHSTSQIIIFVIIIFEHYKLEKSTEYLIYFTTGIEVHCTLIHTWLYSSNIYIVYNYYQLSTALESSFHNTGKNWKFNNLFMSF